MIQAIPRPVSFDEFMTWYPENSEHRYELHDGEIVEMPKPIGKHSEVGGFLSGILFVEIARLQLPYFIPKECIVKVNESGCEPDVVVLQRTIGADIRWKKEPTITRGESARLVIEIVSSNWSDDYALKLEDYEALGIKEYWICYLGLGGKRYIGTPKQPTVSVYRLDAVGTYQCRQFRGQERIESAVFPELQLSLAQILAVLQA